MPDSQLGVWEVFHQQARGEPHVHVGSIHAPDAAMALILAKEQYARRQACVNLWVVPHDAITATHYEDADMFLHPTDKSYRESWGYKTPRTIRHEDTEGPTLMRTIDSPAVVSPEIRSALVDLLYRMADDEIVIGHRNSEWTGHGPILEADIAYSSMAQDEMGHAHTYYQLLHELGEADPDTLVFGRRAEQFRCCSLVSLPKGDWAFSLVRQFLYDTAEHVRLVELTESAYVPLAQVARKLQSEEKYHLMHGRTWVLRLGSATQESHGRMQQALDSAWPHALGMFESTEESEALRQYEICPAESKLCAQWQSAVAPVFGEAGLTVPQNVEPVYGGRRGRHDAELEELLESMQLVYSIDPAAQW